jgi:hypothetical protein
VIPASRGDEIVRLRPNVELRELRGPHLALVTDPDSAWAELQRFIAP